MRNLKLFVLGLFVLFSNLTFAQDIEYRLPPKEICDIIMSQPLPTFVFGNKNENAVILQRNCSLVPLSELASDELRIGGIRINPNNFSETRESFSNSLYILNLASGKSIQVSGMPTDPVIKNIIWSPSDKYFCFTNNTKNEVELWRVNVTEAEPKAEKINKYKVNTIFGAPYSFIDDETILYKSVPDDSVFPQEEPVPTGPIVQESLGKRNSARTSQDLLKNPYDKKLYDYYCTSVLAVYSNGTTTTVGEKRIFRSYELSPDCSYIMVTTEHRPYSYLEGHRSFPNKQEIWNMADGSSVKMLNDGTKKNNKPKKDTLDKKEPNKSNFAWRNDLPATLTWVESEGGAPREFGGQMGMPPTDDNNGKDEDKPEKKFTDKLYQCEAPFNFDEKVLVFAPEYRIGRVTWGNEKFALTTETSSKQKFRQTVSFVPCDTNVAPKILFSESTDVDTLGVFPVYGRPYTVKNQYDKPVVYVDAKGSFIYLTDNSRPDVNGDQMSFIDKLTLKNGKIENVWMGAAPYQDRIMAITDFSKLKFITQRQGYQEAPNFYSIDVKGKKTRQISFFDNTVPHLEGVTREFVTYKRADGVTLYANLYLPAGYDKEKDGKLPVLMWGYPYEYKCVAEAEKVRPPRYNFIRPSYGSAILWVTQGYAIMDGITMPIIAEAKDKEPNDVYIKQLVMNAEAAINFVDSIGVGDRERVAVGGHSYGGFMTANLLAHSNLFKAGIARSGAYNRSLTPFGFQSERRNYWKAKDVYDNMSPFNYADKLKTPILLIHGQMDNNSGTFPIQSERLYQALVGLGGTARYVQLPYESHSYLAIENVLHMLYETDTWLDNYLSPSKD